MTDIQETHVTKEVKAAWKDPVLILSALATGFSIFVGTWEEAPRWVFAISAAVTGAVAVLRASQSDVRTGVKLLDK